MSVALTFVIIGSDCEISARGVLKEILVLVSSDGRDDLGWRALGLAVPAIAATVSSPLALIASDAAAQGANNTPTFNFKEVAAGVDDKHYVAEGYDADILIRWGDCQRRSKIASVDRRDNASVLNARRPPWPRGLLAFGRHF